MKKQEVLSLRKADKVMNNIYERVKTQEVFSQQELPGKLHDYLNTECSIPLPKYQDGGVFSNYIQSNQFATANIARPATLEISTQEKYQKEKEEAKTRANTQNVSKLGKVHLTKRMVKDRELFLGVVPRNAKSKASNLVG